MLEQINVVTLEQAVAAPLCTSRLAQAGAEVIKIERPEGDFARYYDSAVAGESAYFVWLNAGKKSVVLDLRTDQGLNALNQLIERADVLVQNLKPGALAKLGIDLGAVHEGARILSRSQSQASVQMVRAMTARLMICSCRLNQDWRTSPVVRMLLAESAFLLLTSPPVCSLIKQCWVR